MYMFIGDYISYIKDGDKYVIVLIYEYNGKKRPIPIIKKDFMSEPPFPVKH